MIEQRLIDQISQKLTALSGIAISDLEKTIIKEIVFSELKDFDSLDIMIVFFLNKNKYAFPSLFLALNQFWNIFEFEKWLSILQSLDHHLDEIISWVFFTGQYMGIDGFHAALDTNFLSLETKALLKQRLKKGAPQPLTSHLEELLSWDISFEHIHQTMVKSGGHPLLKAHDYYRTASNCEE